MKPTRNLNEAIAQGFVVTRHSYTVANAFLRWCEGSGHPYVCVRLKTTFAVVELDEALRRGTVEWDVESIA